jgi:hypothetical protein
LAAIHRAVALGWQKRVVCSKRTPKMPFPFEVSYEEVERNLDAFVGLRYVLQRLRRAEAGTLSTQGLRPEDPPRFEVVACIAGEVSA